MICNYKGEFVYNQGIIYSFCITKLGLITFDQHKLQLQCNFKSRNKCFYDSEKRRQKIFETH